MLLNTPSQMVRGFEGMVGHSFHKQVDSIICDETNGVNFGRIVAYADDTGTTGRLPIAGDTENLFCGISKQINKVPDSEGVVLYKDTELINKVVKGSVFVVCSDDFDVNDSVYVRLVDGATASTKVGMVRSVITDAVLWTKARFKNKGTAGQLAEIEINLP